MPSVLTIGDCIVDAVEIAPGQVERHPGGAALNLAVGLSRLGHESALATRFGLDRDGFRLARYLRDEQVRFFNPPNVDPTGVVYSSRLDGEPTYHFTPAMFRRRIAFTEAVGSAVLGADAIAVNSFPFDDGRQATALAKVLGQASGLVVVDPNPRANLIRDKTAFREGAEKSLALAAIAKISDEDAHLLYDVPADAVVARLFAVGVETVLFTHGAAGATVYKRGGLTVAAPIAGADGAIIDTMGAGDATLAACIAFMLRHGIPANERQWHACLDDAMRVAAATCRSAGGALVAPVGFVAAPVSSLTRDPDLVLVS